MVCTYRRLLMQQSPGRIPIGLFQKKSKYGGCGYTFLKSPSGNYRFVTLLLTLELLQICVTPLGLEIPESKTKTHGNSALLFLEHPQTTSFLNDAWNFHMFFLQEPRKFHVLNPPCLDFLKNSPFWVVLGITGAILSRCSFFPFFFIFIYL